MAQSDANEVAASLESAIAATEGESSTPQTSGSQASVTKAGEAETNQSVPYARFKDVNDEKNDFRSKWEQSAEKLETYQGKISEQEDLLNRIRGMAMDPNLRPHVEVIDNALQGYMPEDLEEEEVDETETQTVEGKQPIGMTSREVRELLEEQRSELEDSQLDQRAEYLYQQATNVAAEYLDQLPEEYTDEHKNILGEVWNNRVDWNRIEQDPGVLHDELASTLTELLDEFPIGSTSALQTSEAIENIAPPTSEERVQTLLNTENLGAVGEDGKPVVGDDDFASLLGEAMRATR